MREITSSAKGFKFKAPKFFVHTKKGGRGKGKKKNRSFPDWKKACHESRHRQGLIVPSVNLTPPPPPPPNSKTKDDERRRRRRGPSFERQKGWLDATENRGWEGVGVGGAIRNYCGTIDKRRLRGRTTERCQADFSLPFPSRLSSSSKSCLLPHPRARQYVMFGGEEREREGRCSHLRNTFVIAVLRGMADSSPIFLYISAETDRCSMGRDACIEIISG